MKKICPRQGETIKFSQSGLGPVGGNIVINMYSPNGVQRLLQPWESIIVDQLSLAANSLDTVNVISFVWGPNGASGAGPAISNQNLVWAGVESVLDPTQQESTYNGFMFQPDEGITLPQGQVLWAVGLNTTVTGAVTGSGRIINVCTQGPRPNWRETLIGRGG